MVPGCISVPVMSKVPVAAAESNSTREEKERGREGRKDSETQRQRDTGRHWRETEKDETG